VAGRGPEREKALRILADTFWSSQGWKSTRVTAPDDFAYAKSVGVMFDEPISISHDGVISDLVQIVGGLMSTAITDAFLASLTSRQLELRSALGSYAVARFLPEHDFVPQIAQRYLGEPSCAVCGLPRRDEEFDLNVLSFERFKWGGVRRDDLGYVWFDLREFAKHDRASPSPEDRQLFRELIEALEALPPSTSAPKAEKALRALQSNKAEREIVLDILGVCGALETPAHHGYSESFVPSHERLLPPLAYIERTYPVCWWKAGDGVNHAALDSFGLST
jgi:hypothetical protein